MHLPSLREKVTCFNPHPVRRPDATWADHDLVSIVQVVSILTRSVDRMQLAEMHPLHPTIEVSILTRSVDRMQRAQRQLKSREARHVSILTRSVDRMQHGQWFADVGRPVDVSILTRSVDRMQLDLASCFNPHPEYVGCDLWQADEVSILTRSVDRMQP